MSLADDVNKYCSPKCTGGCKGTGMFKSKYPNGTPSDCPILRKKVQDGIRKQCEEAMVEMEASIKKQNEEIIRQCQP